MVLYNRVTRSLSFSPIHFHGLGSVFFAIFRPVWTFGVSTYVGSGSISHSPSETV